MGIDYGAARIGVALSDPTHTLATPFAVVETKDKREQIERVVALMREHEVGLVVVGLAVSLDGTLGETARNAQRYAAKLHEVTGVPVEHADERFTTVEAHAIARRNDGKGGQGRGGGRRGAVKRGDGRGAPRVDAIAAAIVLQEFLDQRTAGI